MFQQPALKCQHITYENGIHEFILDDSSIQAIDDWISHLDGLYKTRAEGDLLRQMIHMRREGLPPMSVVGDRTRALDKRHPHRPRTRTVVLSGSGAMARVLNVFASFLNNKGKDNSRFFVHTEREQAIAWLLEGT